MKLFWTIVGLLCFSVGAAADELDIYRGKPVAVTARIMLLIDTSGSMDENIASLDEAYVCPVNCRDSAERPTCESKCVTKMEALKETLGKFLDVGNAAANASYRWPDKYEVGLARYSEPGGVILAEVKPLDTAYPDNKTQREVLAEMVDHLTPDGSTPLVGSYLETIEYLKGGIVVSGESRNHSVATVWDGGVVGDYHQGMNEALICGVSNNHLVVLTDGRSTFESMSTIIAGDNSITMGQRIQQRVKGNDLLAYLDQPSDPDKCAATVHTERNETPDNNLIWGCANALAKSMVSVDVKGKVSGIRTHTIAYNLGNGTCGETPFANPTTSVQYLCNWAKNGQGNGYVAQDAGALENAFKSLTADIQVSDSFVSVVPGVSVNQSNRFEFLNDIYFSVFQPTDRQFWYGNLKKYQISQEKGVPFIADERPRAVDDNADGFFDKNTRSFWFHASDYLPDIISSDGPNVILGGAALRLPEKNARYLYTQIGSDTVRVDDSSKGDVAALMLPTTYPDAQTQTDMQDKMTKAVEWLRGEDALDVNNEWARLNEELGFAAKSTRTLFGAPIHSSPVVVNYASTTVSDGNQVALPTDDQENLVFVSTNDGKLYAVDSSTGEEKLAFVPGELLQRPSDAEPSRMEQLYDAARGNLQGGSPLYGLDSTWTAWRQDVNRDGNITTGSSNDFVYLYGGMRRGGRNYYAVDVTEANESTPVLEQKFALIGGESGTPFANIGQTWSEPVLGMIKYNGDPVVVMIVGGGYDPVYDAGRPAVNDKPMGSQLYIVAAHDRKGVNNSDIKAGEVLWWGSADTGISGTHHMISDLKHSIPSTVKTLDKDGDGFVDHIYVGDLGGQVLRFDLDVSNSGNSNLISQVAVVAQLGLEGNSTARTPDDDRRFYFPPSLALMKDSGGKYVGIAMGSGLLTDPSDEEVDEKFYFIKDYHAMGGVADTQVFSESLTLESEKLLGSPLIVGGTAFFSTYYWGDNSATVGSDECHAQYGRAALYSFRPSIDNAIQLIGKSYPQSMAGTITTMLQTVPPGDGGGEGGDGGDGGTSGGDLRGLVGPGAFDLPDVDLGNIRKTRWKQCSDEACL